MVTPPVQPPNTIRVRRMRRQKAIIDVMKKGGVKMPRERISKLNPQKPFPAKNMRKGA